MASQTGFILLSSLVSKSPTCDFTSIIEKRGELVIDDVQKTEEAYSFVTGNHNERIFPEVEHTQSEVNNFIDMSQPLPLIPEIVRKHNQSADEKVTKSNQVTHIEIIKSIPGGFRRLAGANRVVPLLTSMWQNNLLLPVDNSISAVYQTFLDDLQYLDDRQCEICNQLLLSSTHVKYHAKEVHGMKDISAEQCFVCRKKYVFKSQLKSHLSVFHGIHYPDLICKICFMEFSTAIEHKAHERKHDSSHTCQICSAKFRSEYFLKEHIETHISLKKPNECKKCGQRFGNSFSLVIHMKRHENVACFLCKEEFQDELLLLFHMSSHKHAEKQKFFKRIELMDQEESQLEIVLNEYVKISSPEEKVEQQSTDVSEVVNKCMEDVLSAVSVSQQKLTSHDSIPSTGVRCKLCEVVVETSQDLIDHRRKVHLRSRTCPFCGRRSKSVRQIWHHMTKHISEKSKVSSPNAENHEPNKFLHSSINKEKKNVIENSSLYGCRICSRKFRYPGSRNKHMLMHNNADTNGWKCEVCGEDFLESKLLIKHMTIHKPQVKCSICNEVFSKRSSLQIHLKSHIHENGKKRFKCNLCSVYCSSASGLEVHYRIHTGERPYSCLTCSKKFRRMQALKKHVLVVHQGSTLKYHNCCDCSMKFNDMGGLMRHYLRIHRQVRRYVCGVCGARYGQNQDLRRHFKVKHQVEMPVIKGTDRKALNEIYVIPQIDNLPDSHPHAQKINRIVAEEKQKFVGVEEMLKKKQKTQNIHILRTDDNEKELDNIKTSDSVNTSTGSDLKVSCKSSVKAALKDGSCQKSCTEHMSGDHRTSCCISYNNNCDMSLYSCPLCHTVFLGENEHRRHVSESKKYQCTKCNKNFCDEVKLQNHLETHSVNQFFCNVCLLHFGDRQAYEKHVNDMNGILPEGTGIAQEALSHRSLHGLVSDVLSHEQESPVGTDTAAGLPNDIFDIGNSMTVLNSTITNIVNIDPGLCNAVAKPLMTTNSDISAAVNSIIPMGGNMNGMICTSPEYLVRNIIIQPIPNIIQSIPVTYTNQNAVSAMPVITLQPSALPALPSSEQHTSVVPVDLTNIAFLNSLESLQMAAQPSNSLVSENVDPDQRALVSQVPVSFINPSETTEILISSSEEQVQSNEQQEMILEPVRDHEEENRRSTSFQLHSPVKYSCKLCGKELPTTSSLSRHIKSHSEVKPFCCFHCGKRFVEKCNLKVHLRVHTGERPYSCEVCGMQLRYQKDVADHKRMHLGVKSYICDECGRDFVRRRVLARHKLTHSGEKRYKCPICDKAFTRREQLKLIHMPTHFSHQQQFSCEKCNKTFRLKSKLKQHIALHSDQKDYPCPTCCKCFARKSYLKAHLETHKKQDWYVQCPKCPRRFASKETLMVHETTFHVRPLKNPSKSSHQKEEKIAEIISNENEPVPEVSSCLEMVDIEIQDMGLDILEGDECNTVVYLHMGRSDDIKFSLNSSNNFTD